VLRATVPETPIHKHRDLRFAKNEIWFAENLLIPPPTGDAMLAEQFHQSQLGVLVAMSANA